MAVRASDKDTHGCVNYRKEFTGLIPKRTTWRTTLALVPKDSNLTNFDNSFFLFSYPIIQKTITLQHRTFCFN